MKTIDRSGSDTVRLDEALDAGISRQLFWAVTSACLVVALIRRWPFMGDPALPIGEGGLFVVFSQAIIDHGFELPLHIRYGGTLIPFAYPPLAFYLSALASEVTGADLFRIYHDLPVILSLLVIPAFCFLAAGFTASRTVFICASLLFSQLPNSFVWLTTGGGMPRSLAALLALLAVGTALRLTSKSVPGARLLCGLLVGLALLSHLEWGMASALGVTAAAVARAKGRQRLALPASVGVVSFLVILPWVLLIIARHGMSPFLSGAASSEWNFNFLNLIITAQILTPLLIWPAILGVLKSVTECDFFAIIWSIMIAIVTPRMGGAAGLAVPAALLSGLGLKMAGDWLTQTAGHTAGTYLPGKCVRILAHRCLAGIRLPTLALLAALSLVLSTPVPWIYTEPSLVRQLGRPTRSAMQWIKLRTEPGSTFVVITDFGFWWGDRIAEWFPLLAGRESLTTVQGTEWAGPGIFNRKKKEVEALKAVTSTAPYLLPDLVRRRYCRASHVAVFSEHSKPLSAPFVRSGSFRLVYRNSEASIFEVRQFRSQCR